MSTTYKPVYAAASAAYTIAAQNVASSATFVAGVESDALSNITNLYDDLLVSGLWTCGTTPTTNTLVQAFVVPPQKDNLAGTVTWPDVFDGTGSAETVTSQGILYGLSRQLGGVLVDSNTSNRAYNLVPTSVALLFGGVLPSQHVLFVTHNTGVNSNSTAGNHEWDYLPIQWQGV